jgi:hypothetical protein
MEISEWDMRTDLLRLQERSVLWDDQRMEDTILHAEMTPELYEQTRSKLLTNRARPDMRGVYSQTDMANFLIYVL